MAKKFRLSSKRKKWAKTTKPTTTLRGSALNHPATVETKYARDVRKIVNRLMRITENEIKDLFKTPEAKEFFAEDAGLSAEAQSVLDDLFKRLDRFAQREAEKAADAMVSGADRASLRGVATSLKELSGGVTISPVKITPEIAEKLAAAINVNVDLITSISSSYLSKVSDAVNRSIMMGNGIADLIPFFENQRGITRRHAKFVALDQTRKAFNSLNVSRMEASGLTEFEWLHSGGGKVPRKFHIDRFPAGLNGGIYLLSDPPVIDEKTGERGLPSQLPSCRCRMLPVLRLDKGVPA